MSPALLILAFLATANLAFKVCCLLGGLDSHSRTEDWFGCGLLGSVILSILVTLLAWSCYTTAYALE